MIDVDKFRAELISEFKAQLPNEILADDSLSLQFLGAMASIATFAIKKYDRENPRQ